YTADEMMAVAAARRLTDDNVCFVGIGLPSVAANLARHTHAPGCTLIYESGTIGAYDAPTVRLPGGGGAPEIALGVEQVFVMLRHSARAFVERLDFTTSLGDNLRVVITDLGILEPHD